jgi:hypothetical protein
MKTYEDYYRLLPNSAVEHPSTMEELDEVGVRFGGTCHFLPQIIRELGRPEVPDRLALKNGAGFSVLASRRLLADYVEQRKQHLLPIERTNWDKSGIDKQSHTQTPT